MGYRHPDGRNVAAELRALQPGERLEYPAGFRLHHGNRLQTVIGAAGVRIGRTLGRRFATRTRRDGSLLVIREE